MDSSVHFIYHDPSDLGSLILIRIISKERTLISPVSMALMRAALDKIATVTSTTRDFKCIERYLSFLGKLLPLTLCELVTQPVFISDSQ